MLIDSNIPIPSRQKPKPPGHPEYDRHVSVVREMQNGDSVFFQDGREATQFTRALNREGCKSVLRPWSGGYRVWKP